MTLLRLQASATPSPALKAAAALAVCIMACSLGAREARAYSDPERFASAQDEGGGGGRYFTGSPRDGYNCGVCHEGGAVPIVAVRGLPENGYDPDETYELRINWRNGDSAHALHVEVTDPEGAGAGELKLVDDEEIPASGRCGSRADGESAGYTLDVEDRRVLGALACGASSLLFRFTPSDVPYLVFAGAVVRSDSSASADGDGVISLNRVLRREDQRHETLIAGCSLTARGSETHLSPLLAVLSVLGWFCWSFRRRARAQLIESSSPTGC